MSNLWSSIKDFLTFQIIEAQQEGDFHLDTWMILLAIVAVLSASFLLRTIKKLLTRKMDEPDRLKFNSIFKFFNYLVYLVVIIAMLNATGLDVTTLLTASAALFVGIGFALQDFFKDIIAGISILVDKSLQVNDIIELDGKVGRVFEIKLRSTRAITRDDKVLVIPNHLFLKQTIFNYTQNHLKTRERITVKVAYNSPVQQVKQILLECAAAQNGVLKSPDPFVLLDEFGTNSLHFSLYFYVQDSFTDPVVKSELRYAIIHEFNQHDIKIPFPQRDVHIITQP